MLTTGKREEPPPTQLSPQIYPDAGRDGDDGNKFEKSVSVDQLTCTLEMEVQDLIDRVSVLEQGHAAVLNLQRSILQKEDRILSRLAVLERHQRDYAPANLNDYSFDGTLSDISFDDIQQRPAYIPPPPQHPPHPLLAQALSVQPPSMLPSQLRPPSAQPSSMPPPQLHPLPAQASSVQLPSTPPPSSPVSDENHTACQVAHPSHHTPPFQPLIMPQVSSSQHRRRAKAPENSLQLSSINRSKLVPAKEIIDRNPKLICDRE